MRIERYDSPEAFGKDVFEILMENEVQNTLPISFIRNDRNLDTSSWLLASVKDDNGNVLLTAACTPPYNIVLYETGNRPNEPALRILASELKAMEIKLPGVLAEQGLAYRFADAYASDMTTHRQLSLILMRLDNVQEIPYAPGFCREMNEEDLFFVPYWMRAFAEECQTHNRSLLDLIEDLRKQIGNSTQYLWEDSIPVSLAAHNRSSENGAVISAVYTPPQYRKHGYASSLVSELSQMLLDRGYQFCSLFADAENPISCSIYRKIGYRDLCVFEDLRFAQREE